MVRNPKLRNTEDMNNERTVLFTSPVCAKCGGKGYYQIGDRVTDAVQCTCQQFGVVTSSDNSEITKLQEENERLKDKIKQQDKEYVLNGSIQEWKDYAERTTKKLEDQKALIKELTEALEKIHSKSKYNRDHDAMLYNMSDIEKISESALSKTKPLYQK